MTCARCQRLNLECKIESNFKRVGKRSKNAEMEREIVELRRQLSLQQASSPVTGPVIKASLSTSASPTISHLPAHIDQYIGSEEAVASLMDLRSGLEGGSFMRSPNAQLLLGRRIGDVILTHDRVQELFQQYVIVRAMRESSLTGWPASLRSTIRLYPFSIPQGLLTITTNHPLYYSGSSSV